MWGTNPILQHSNIPLPFQPPDKKAAAEVAAPRPGTCWVMTKIVVHYHVGIRHYSATDPYQLAVCSDSAQVKAAMNAASSAS